MEKYYINKLDKMIQKAKENYREPIKILCVYENEGKLAATLLFDNGAPREDYSFKSEEELQKYIQENNITNVIENLCIDMI